MSRWPALACVLALSAAPALAAPRRLESADYYRMRAVTSVQLSPDGTRIAYTVQTNDGPGRPRTQLWVMTLPDGAPARVGGRRQAASDPDVVARRPLDRVRGASRRQGGADVAGADGSAPARRWRRSTGTNSPLTFEGRAIAWSPDSQAHRLRLGHPGPGDGAGRAAIPS